MGGDHKCPLCSATFTRPQHVGRHLRAHTGDRPYECKHCPLRFARSDLLSRHVNKAHKPPDENAPQKDKTSKKGRRKSFPASALKKPTGLGDNPDPTSTSQDNYQNNIGAASQSREKPRASSFNQQSQLQAQRMYPHHPLLNGQNPADPYQTQIQTWSNNPSQAYATTATMTNNLSSSPYAQTFANPVTGTGNPNAILGNPGYPSVNNTMSGEEPPFTAAPMRITGSEQGYSSIGQVPLSNPNGILYEWGFKKRACDQCNHSKVRCDFADPCLRCTHRNIKCSYNKPQKSRSIGYPHVPTQTAALGQYVANHLSTGQFQQVTGGPMMASPQSQFSSPDPNSSPVASSHVPVHHQRAGSVSSLPPASSIPHPAPARQSNSVSSLRHHGNYNGLQNPESGAGVPQYSSLPIGTAPGTITGHLQQSPATYNASLQASAVYDPASSFNTGIAPNQEASPPQGLATTPSLTNNTTSPPDIDEPFERRSSYTGTTGGFLPGHEWQEQSKQFKTSNPAPTLQTHNSDPAYIIPFNSSPILSSPTQPNATSSYVPSANNLTYQWSDQPAQTADLNAAWQARHNSVSDDDNGSALSASTNSTFIDLNEAQFDPAQLQGHHRRRSSAGQWTNALAQMSLQDPLNGSDSSYIPLPEPYTANTAINAPFASHANQAGSMTVPDASTSRRPTFPTLTGVTEEAESEPQPMPSLSDVKDLWRLFMTEPMTGLTPMGENQNNELELTSVGGPLVTPRPGMGKRTLSKSNSMPDLQSPLLNGPQFFNNFLNGLTPRATDNQNQSSYIPPQQVAPSSNTGTAPDNADIRKWSEEIKHRQNSFSLSGQPNNKLGKTQSQLSFGGNMGMNNPDRKASRPLPSVVQRSSALEQTLAPERVPSFGVPQSFYVGSGDGSQMLPPSHLQKLTSNPNPNPTQTQTKMLSGVPPHMARPGNKRLASQTLVPGETGKKATFSLYDDGTESEATAQSTAHLQPQPQQPQQFQQSHNNPISQTQANSMFYPNWSLSSQTQTASGPTR
ncbi:uncharacterized protein I303_101139 [Kwoniella dejecticola CBS 10117]|uniref:Zn(2)-C6 fungal-type domain-containing protein n=1 Tax=Kwoniella dejecticola CBS 10117 TaxID=1296121 RepID=A0A1A6AGY1_9TREE|nr:uncharacterized protein I303_01145 [Kwoniella dejecticola CBS 10117]OBR89319.1 hypothetical protein I303_01145 [Kwoniella dejecticola CBS 10117]